jgi:hypothetical protein
MQEDETHSSPPAFRLGKDWIKPAYNEALRAEKIFMVLLSALVSTRSLDYSDPVGELIFTLGNIVEPHRQTD